MSSNDEPTPEARRKQWLRRLCDEFIKLEALFPAENFLPDEGLPKWVQNIERELGATMFPVARVKKGFEPTPKRLGGIIGHACAYGVWLVEWVAETLGGSETALDESKLTPEQLAFGNKFIQGLLNEWYPALRRLAKRALCSTVDQSYEDMRDFLLAYSEAFSRKPKAPNAGDIGNSATELYFYMIVHWKVVNAMNSVHELHQWLVKRFGPHQVGELKRIEKICQRIELHYRRRGRPKRAS